MFLALALGGYFVYTQFKMPAVGTALSIGQTQLLGGDFLAMVEKLKILKINFAFFSDETYVGMKDLTPVIATPPVVGRPNPFSGF